MAYVDTLFGHQAGEAPAHCVVLCALLAGTLCGRHAGEQLAFTGSAWLHRLERSCASPLLCGLMVGTVFGHQADALHLCIHSALPPAEVLGLDAGRAERCVSCAADRTCRVWKIPEESQLIFR